MNTSLYAPNTGLKVEASIDPGTIQGSGGVTWPRLILQVMLQVNQEGDRYWQGRTQAVSFGILTGELLVGSETIAYLRPIALNRRQPGNLDHPMEVPVTVEIELDARRIEWMEQQRAGKSLDTRLRITLQTQVFGSLKDSPNFPFGLIEASSIYGEIPFTCPDMQWREKVLPGLGYGKVIALELPAVSVDTCKELAHSFKALEKAQRHFQSGLYDDAVAACRVALDPFFELVEKEGEPDKRIPKLKKSWERTLGAATYQWLDSTLGAIKTTANKPHHSPNCHFDRFGAQMLLVVTTAVIAYVARHGDSGDQQ